MAQNIPNTFLLKGTIYDEFNAPLAKVKVKAFDKDLRSEHLLGEAVTDKKGQYLIKYNDSKFSWAEKASADVFIRVFKNSPHDKKEIGKSPAFFNVSAEFTLDFKIDGTPYTGLSEFDTLVNTIAPLLKWQRVTMANLKEDEKFKDISFLSAETGVDASIISLLPTAFKHNEATKNNIPPDIFYGLFRLQFPTKLNELLLVKSESIINGIKEAINKNIISSKWEKQIEGFIKKLNELSTQFMLSGKEEENVAFKTMIATTLPKVKLQKTFIDTFLANESEPEKIWNELLKKDGFTDGKAIADTKSVLRLNLLTNQPILAAHLYKLQARDPELKEIRGYAKLTKNDFAGHINKLVSSGEMKSFPDGIEGKTPEDKTNNYAGALEDLVRELYPTDVFRNRMSKDVNHPFGESKVDLHTFLAKNQDFDLNTTKINTLLKESDLSGIRNLDKLKNELTKVNRIYKLSPNYEETSTILNAGLNSAFDIAQMPETEFVNVTSSSAKITKTAAKKLHSKAVLIDNRTTALATKIKTEGDINIVAMGGNSEASSDYQSMFGDSNLCDCEYCQSVYSPSAYFVDMLNYMKNNASAAFDVLIGNEANDIIGRRPDLEHILLTCKNTNTPLPYIDLVNEVLENQIANPNAPIDPNTVPQTNNTAEELAAFPEHVNNEAYVKIREDISTFQLPLQLHLEETRMYLEKLNCQRYELMELFYGKQTSDIYSDINIAAEYLKLSGTELEIINGNTARNVVLSDKIQDYLTYTGLSYLELKQVLECRFANPTINGNNNRTITIDVATDITLPDGSKIPESSCNIEYLRFKGLTDDLFKKHLRFILLWKKLNWDIYDLDRIITAIGKQGTIPESTDIDNQLIIRLAQVGRLREGYKLSVSQVLALWADLPIDSYSAYNQGKQTDIISFYDALFQNKELSNPLDTDFQNPNGFPNSPSIKLKAKSEIITSVYNISESGFNTLNSILLDDGNLTLENLSIIYRYSTLARMLHVKIEDLLLLIKITGNNPLGSVDNTADTFGFINAVNLIKSSGFSLAALSGLLIKETSDSSTIDDDTIANDLMALQAGLKKIEDLFPEQPSVDETLKKSTDQIAFITEFLCNAFGAESKIIEVMLNDMLQLVIEPFIDSLFINSTQKVVETDTLGDAIWAFPDVFNNYLLLHKTWERIFLITDTLSISVDEFVFFQNHEIILDLEGIWTLPTNTEDGDHYESFENLVNLLEFREVIKEVREDWYLLLDPSKSREEFVDSLVSMTSLLKEDLKFLISAEGLNLITAADYLIGKHLLNIYACAKKAEQLGSSCENLEKLAKPKELLNTDALLARSILKGKYDESTWLAIIKPISNVLREKKRDALVNYLLKATNAETKVFRSKNNISESNDLYAHFLIDSEMAACMITSRIKQAISSVQLFIDRCLMGIENNVDQNAKIELTEDFVTQWNEWRKVYRVWEANRKVFLYPENWIEPDLRDDKSPFFKELESKLTQNEVTDDIAKDALLEYLEKLDTVANLEIIAFFSDELTGITHVLGRTKNIPHQYFYRKQEKSVWTAWEKVELDIQGDHILLVVWNNRLMVFWGEFNEKEKRGGTSPLKESNGVFNSDKTEKYLEMKLNWSEYKNNKWGSKNISEEVVTIDRDVMGFNLYNKNQISLSSFIINKKLFIRLIAPWVVNLKDTSWLENNDYLATIYFDNCNSTPHITYVNTTEDGFNQLGVAGIKGTKLNTMFQDEGNVDSFTIYKSGLYKPLFASESNNIEIFSHTPGKYQILPNHHEIGKSMPIKFFYSNERSNFYVKTVVGLPTLDQDAILDTPGLLMDRRTINPLESASRSDVLAPINTPDETGGSDFNIDLFNPPFEMAPQSFQTINRKTLYKFQTFYHPYVCDYIKVLNTDGLDVLYKENIQLKSDINIFSVHEYGPSKNVNMPGPLENIDFSSSGAYSLYNWELFFHIPLLIASSLSQNQKFEEARKWFHYIFDPTKSIDDTLATNKDAKRFWITKPFKEQIDQQKSSIEELINQENNSEELDLQLQNWENNPFNPHAVARFRKSVYMRSTVMKYIDNLMDWGDQLFRRDSIESINEATLLYVLAANLLGKQPENIPSRAQPVDSTFNTIKAALNPFNNAKVAIEAFLSHSEINELSIDAPIGMPLFCLPKNAKLLGYWDNVADKLFKVRHCMNIDGVVRQLPLFEPPIDPALLIRARAAGLDLNSVLNDINASLPIYRFQFILQKANELCNDVKSLGGQLLASLEKKDAEELSLLHSSHEIQLLSLMHDIKRNQINEAKENLNALNCSKRIIEERKNYYSSRPYKNDKESKYLESLNDAALYQTLQGANDVLASVLFTLPDVTVGAWSWGAKSGGTHAAGASKAISTSLGVLSNFEITQGNIANVEGGYDRRQEEWDFQTKTAELELKQIDKQIIAAEIRLAIAEKDFENHKVQIENTKEVDEFMRSKFTNKELYQYMIKQISSVYFQSYQLAYEVAKKAEKCLQYELGIENTSFVKFGYWDSLKKGLLSGEKLQYDLRRLENAYLEENKREYEIVKHVSIAMLNPLALIQLRSTGKCEFSIPEVLYDMDHPGHYMRRLKSVSVSLPCIAGPFTSVSANLKLIDSHCRVHKDLLAESLKQFGKGQAIATSNAQNDSGVFELNFKDERYLPFEGAGAISTWQLELPSEIKQFDYNTISDAILHIKYTARAANELKNEVNSKLKELLNNITQQLGKQGLHIAINMKHDLSNEWHQLKTSGHVSLKIIKSKLPYMVQSIDTTKIESVMFIAKIGDKPDTFKIILGDGVDINFENVDGLMLSQEIISDIKLDNSFTLSALNNDDKEKLEELIIIVKYTF